MKIESRLVISYFIRLVFLLFAGWVALFPQALPDAHQITRIALAAQFLVFSIVVGEVAKLHAQFEILLKALRSAGAKVTGKPERSPDEAIDILIRALGSREARTRENAHKNLVRITGEDLPPDPAAWRAWVQERRQASDDAD